MHTEGIWTLVVIVGPILLAIVLIWAKLHNRGSRAELARTEEATRRNYERQDAIDKANAGS